MPPAPIVSGNGFKSLVIAEVPERKKPGFFVDVAPLYSEHEDKGSWLPKNGWVRDLPPALDTYMTASEFGSHIDLLNASRSRVHVGMAHFCCLCFGPCTLCVTCVIADKLYTIPLDDQFKSTIAEINLRLEKAGRCEFGFAAREKDQAYVLRVLVHDPNYVPPVVPPTPPPPPKRKSSILVAASSWAKAKSYELMVVAPQVMSREPAEPAFSKAAVDAQQAAAKEAERMADERMAKFRQWPSRAVGASSEYNSSSWSYKQVQGPPKVYPKYGDRQGAWAPKSSNGKDEWIVLEFEPPMLVGGIDIYETFNPGAVVKIEFSRDAGYGSAFDTVWTGGNQRGKLPKASRIFSPTLAQPYPHAVKQVKLTLQTTGPGSWSEIDTVQLHPQPQAVALQPPMPEPPVVAPQAISVAIEPPARYGYDLHGAELGQINGRYLFLDTFNGAPRYKQNESELMLLYLIAPPTSSGGAAAGALPGSWLVTDVSPLEGRHSLTKREQMKAALRAFSPAKEAPPLGGWIAAGWASKTTGAGAHSTPPVLTPFGTFPKGIDKFGGVSKTIRVSGAGTPGTGGSYERAAPEQGAPAFVYGCFKIARSYKDSSWFLSDTSIGGDAGRLYKAAVREELPPGARAPSPCLVPRVLPSLPSPRVGFANRRSPLTSAEECPTRRRGVPD